MRYISTISFIFLYSFIIAQVDLTPDRFEFEPDLEYNPSITSPADFLGYELGESFTLYANSVQYFKLLAEQSPRITINEYGETYEGRKLYNLTITSESNHASLPEIKGQNDKLSDPI